MFFSGNQLRSSPKKISKNRLKKSECYQNLIYTTLDPTGSEPDSPSPSSSAQSARAAPRCDRRHRAHGKPRRDVAASVRTEPGTAAVPPFRSQRREAWRHIRNGGMMRNGVGSADFFPYFPDVWLMFGGCLQPRWG